VSNDRTPETTAAPEYFYQTLTIGSVSVLSSGPSPDHRSRWRHVSAPETTWRPIATAPRDGTEFDAWHPGLERVPAVSWDVQREPDAGWMMRVTNENCTTWFPIYDLVLWYPAPPPPEIGALS